MGVYIHGMEMPTSCAFCRFCEGLADTLRGTCALCMVDGKHRDAQTNDGCPLVFVPEHGDLIDRNALPWEKQGKMLTDPDEWGLKATDIENAPTIIPADPVEVDNG